MNRAAALGNVLVAFALTLPAACSLTAASLGDPQTGFPVTAAEEPQANSSAARSLSDAVFSRRQASRGERRFQQACAACHRTSEMTRTMLRSGVNETVGDIFEQVSTTMPQANPGGLSAADYADILAFIFRLSDYPAGEEDLPADLSLLKSVRIEAP